MVQTISDDEAIGRIRSGDINSYEVLAARYHGRLHWAAQRVVHNHADAEDAVQTAHVRALRNIDQYAGRSGYYTWIYSIVVNEARTQMRRSRKRVDIGEAYAWTLSSPARSPEQQAIDQEVGRILQQAVHRLPSTYQPVFLLCEMENLSIAETGERLGLSNACVKTRLFRAKNMLRRTLAGVLRAQTC